MSRAVLALMALVVLAGCAEATNEATAVVNPAEPVIDRRFIEQAEAALDQRKAPDGWRQGVVYVKDPDWWTLGVITEDGPIAIEDAKDYCGEGDWQVLDRLMVLTEPGDLVQWSTTGDDNRVCGHEIKLVEKVVVDER